MWTAGGHGPEARAQAVANPRGQAGGEAAGTFAFTSPMVAPAQGHMLYLIDTKTQAFAVYRVDPRRPAAAR